LPLPIVDIHKIYSAEFDKGFITKIHNGFFARFLNLPQDFKTLRVYLNILLSDGTRYVKACIVDGNLHDRYVQLEEYKKGETLLMELKLTSGSEIEKALQFVLEEA